MDPNTRNDVPANRESGTRMGLPRENSLSSKYRRHSQCGSRNEIQVDKRADRKFPRNLRPDIRTPSSITEVDIMQVVNHP